MTPFPKLLYQDDPLTGDYRFFQLGCVVDDLLAAAGRWIDLFGVGPFHVLPRRRQTYLYRGVPTEIDMQVALVQCGPVLMELIQQFDDGPSAFREMFGEGEQGLHHVCTVTADYDGTVSRYASRGYEVIGEFGGANRACYIDTRKDFGFLCEVVERSDPFMGHVARIAETCANWQGEDPIRLLTRDGYRTPDPATA